MDVEEIATRRLAPATQGSAWAVRLKPYEDIVTSLCAFAAERGVRRVSVIGCVGSLMHATLLGPERRVRRIDGPGVEVVTAAGWVDAEQPAGSTLTLTVADREGRLHAGRAAPGGNPVCVTMELILEGWT